MLDDEVDKEMNSNIAYFNQIEQSLIEEGHKGQHVLIYGNRQLYGFGKDDKELIKRFYAEKGKCACVLREIGSERKPRLLPGPRREVKE